MKSSTKLIMIAAVLASFLMTIAAGLIAATTASEEVRQPAPQVVQAVAEPKPSLPSNYQEPVATPVQAPTKFKTVYAIDDKTAGRLAQLEKEVEALQARLDKANTLLADWKAYQTKMEDYVQRHGLSVSGEDNQANQEPSFKSYSVPSSEMGDSYCPDCQKNNGSMNMSHGRRR